MGAQDSKMSSRVERANKLLDSVSNRVGLSEAGKHWLIATLDPMHDDKLVTTGYPDRESGASIVQVVKRSASVRKPGTMPAGAWNLSVIADNDMIAWNHNAATLTQNHYHVPVATNDILPIGGLCCVASLDTLGSTLPYTDGSTNTSLTTALTLDPNISDSKFRILAVGFEIVNTTPDLYKSGSLAVWEQPLSNHAICSYLGQTTGQTADAAFDVRSMILDTAPPRDLAAALLLQGSQQWTAAAGCYCALTMSTLDNPPKYTDTIGKVYINDDGVPNLQAGLTTYGCYIEPGAISLILNEHTAPGVRHVVPYNRKGAYLMGLSEQSTFTVNYNVVIETFPSQTNIALVTLASPSPCEDTVATNLYSHIVCRLPVGCRFGDNDLGEWFLGVVDNLANVVNSIARPVLSTTIKYQALRQAQRSNAPAPVRGEAASTWTSQGSVVKMRPPQPAKPKPQGKARPKQQAQPKGIWVGKRGN